MKYCEKCGQEIGNNKFCVYCGYKQSNKKRIVIVISIVMSLLIVGLIFFLTQPNNEDIMVEGLNDYFEINNEINDLVSEFESSNGYIKKENIKQSIGKIGKYAKQLYEEGKIEDYDETEGVSVWMKFKSGIEYVYIPAEEGCDSTAINTFQPCLNMYDNQTQEHSNECLDGSAEYIANKLDEYIFENNFDNIDVTLEVLKSLGENQINIWHGHGGYNKKIHSFIQTGIELNETQFLLDPVYYVKKIGYTKDYLSGRIVCTSSGYIAVKKDFFEFYLGEIDGSVIYLGTCHSGDDDVLANVFISKGAKTVIANESTICTEYDLNMIKTVLTELVNSSSQDRKYNTLQQALMNAEDINGKTCCSEHDARVLIFGDKNFRLSPDMAPERKYISGENLIEIDGKIICAKNDGVYYKESINNKGTKIVSAKNVDILMSDGQNVFYVVCDRSDAVATETFSLPHTLYSVNIDGSDNIKICSNENKMEPLCCYDNDLYYFKQTDYGSGTLNKVDLSTGENIDLGSDVLEECAENWVDPMGCLGDKIYFFNKNRSGKQNKDSIVSYDLSTNRKNIELNDATFVFQQLKQYQNMLYFYGFQQNEDYKKTDTYLYTINSNNELSKSIELPSDLSIQIMDSNCEYVICFNDEQSDIDTMFDMYRVDLKTGDVITSKGEAGRYKNKNYFVTYDLANPEDIYFMYNVGLYDKSANKIVNKKHDDFEIDIMKPMWIINGYVVDSNINTYKIYDETNDTSNIEKISSDEAVDIARQNAGGDGYGATYVKNVEYNGEEYYLINIKWRVDDGDGKFHYSHIGYSIVSLDGKDVKNADYINGQVQVY